MALSPRLCRPDVAILDTILGAGAGAGAGGSGRQRLVDDSTWVICGAVVGFDVQERVAMMPTVRAML